MKLSIVIVNYNTQKLSMACLKSIDKYPLNRQFEVIFVDNASVDNSLKKVRRFKPKNFKLKIIIQTFCGLSDFDQKRF